MPGLHRYHTIAFRPTTWERELIEKRSELSGLLKKDFIIQSCIHSKVVVAVTRERMLRIIGEVQEMRDVMKEEYLALAVAVVDILGGGAYLFGYGTSEGSPKWKAVKDVDELAEAVKR